MSEPSLDEQARQAIQSIENTSPDELRRALERAAATPDQAAFFSSVRGHMIRFGMSEELADAIVKRYAAMASEYRPTVH